MQQYNYEIFVSGYSFTVIHSVEIVSKTGSTNESEILARNNGKLSEFFRKKQVFRDCSFLLLASSYQTDVRF